MAWLKILLISMTILVLCRGKESPCRIWSERGHVVLYNEYVFCQCNGTGTTSSDIQFIVSNKFPPLEIVDNFTVKLRVPTDYPRFARTCNLDMYCFGPDRKYTTIILKIVSQLNVTDFKCRSYQNEDVGNCTFSVCDPPINLVPHFFVSTNGSPKVMCENLVGNDVKCQNVKINQSITQNLFKIGMELKGIVRSEEIILNLREIVIPSWELVKKAFEFEYAKKCNCMGRVKNTGLFYEDIKKMFRFPYGDLDCYGKYSAWNHAFFELSSYQESAFYKSEFITFKCFPNDFPGYKKLKHEISCRFRNNVPWSEKYIYNCTTKPILPSKPPKISPNGFFYVPDQKLLYIFWFHLDEIDWNGPNFGYAARSSDGKNGIIVANTTALFLNWEAALPASIVIWSENSVGPSGESSRLNLSSLANVYHQQSRNNHYNDEEKVLRWDPPTDTNNLVGYTVYWCTASLNIYQICDTKDELRMQDLSLSQHQYRFPKSMNFSNMAVAVRYSDKIGGGMRWTGYKWIINETPSAEPQGAGISYYLAPIGVSILIALCIYVYRICRKCNDIEVVLCEGLLLDRNISPPTPEAPVVFSGCVSPETVMDINRLVPPKTAEMENESQEEDSASE